MCPLQLLWLPKSLSILVHLKQWAIAHWGEGSWEQEPVDWCSGEGGYSACVFVWECVCGATGCWEREQGQGEGVKNKGKRDEEGDWGQGAICCEEDRTGIWYSGSTLVQSLLVGLPARFPSGHSINSRLLTLTQPDWERGDQVPFSFPPSPAHASHVYTRTNIYTWTNMLPPYMFANDMVHIYYVLFNHLLPGMWGFLLHNGKKNLTLINMWR